LFNFLEDKAVLLSISSEYIKLSAQWVAYLGKELN
jgi:hypothetical protein